MNKIVAVVVTYNRLDLLKENIEALLNQSYSDLDVFIIDNNSSDGTKDYVTSITDERLFYFNTGRNLGGAGGFAFGVNKALCRHYKYIWVMDDDTIPSNDALESLVTKAKLLENNFSFLTSVACWIDGNQCNMNRQDISIALNDIKALKNHLLLVSYASFVSCFMNADICRKVGLPISEFFIYGDDIEYTQRLSRELPGYLDQDSHVVHKMKENVTGDIFDCSDDRIDRFNYCFKNGIYSSKRSGNLKAMLFKDFKRLIKIILRKNNKKLKRIRVLFKGVFKGFFFNPDIITDYREDLFETFDPKF